MEKATGEMPSVVPYLDGVEAAACSHCSGHPWPLGGGRSPIDNFQIGPVFCLFVFFLYVAFSFACLS